MQGLQAMWDLPLKGYSWATGGYLGAILSGKTTCGLLIGSTIAIGLRCGEGKDAVPEEHQVERGKAINGVRELYADFLKEFGSTDCQSLSHFDFSNPEEISRYVQDKAWKNTCDIFLKFVMNKCTQMAEEGKV